MATAAAIFFTGNRSASGGHSASSQRQVAKHTAGDQDHVQPGDREDVGEAGDLQVPPGRLIEPGPHPGDQRRRHGAGRARADARRSGRAMRARSCGDGQRPARRSAGATRSAGPSREADGPQLLEPGLAGEVERRPARAGGSGRLQPRADRDPSRPARGRPAPAQVDADRAGVASGGHVRSGSPGRAAGDRPLAAAPGRPRVPRPRRRPGAAEDRCRHRMRRACAKGEAQGRPRRGRAAAHQRRPSRAPRARPGHGGQTARRAPAASRTMPAARHGQVRIGDDTGRQQPPAATGSQRAAFLLASHAPRQRPCRPPAARIRPGRAAPAARECAQPLLHRTPGLC